MQYDYRIFVDNEQRLQAEGTESEARKAFSAMGEGLNGLYSTMELHIAFDGSRFQKCGVRYSDGNK